MKDFWKDEVINGSTRCWCQGMDGWRPLQHIPQLKWFLLATGLPLMNETDMTVLILNMLIRICSYYPNRYVYIPSCTTRNGTITLRHLQSHVIWRMKNKFDENRTGETFANYYYSHFPP